MAINERFAAPTIEKELTRRTWAEQSGFTVGSMTNAQRFWATHEVADPFGIRGKLTKEPPPSDGAEKEQLPMPRSGDLTPLNSVKNQE